MKTQQAGKENTLLEVNVIPEEMDVLPRSTASPELPKHSCVQGIASLVRMMGLVILGLVLGFILAMVIYKAGKQDPGPPSDMEEVYYVTGNLTERRVEKSRYNIFTAPKNAHYNIYVRVRHQDKNHKRLVYLQRCWDSAGGAGQSDCVELTPHSNIHSEEGSYFTEKSVEEKLYKGSRVSLLFNEENDIPVVEKSVFHIFEIRQRGNGH